VFLDLGGTVRTRSAEHTLAWVEPLLPKFGITRLAALEGLGNLKIPVTICFRPNGRGQSTSQGKGINRVLADVSAIMEAVELFHAERLPQASMVASVAELRRSGRPFVDPVRLSKHPHESLYSEHEPLGWLELRRATDGGAILAPRFYLDLDRAAQPTEISSIAFDATSNGLASGNTLEEAIVHGLYELIERHCFTEYIELDLAQRRARSLQLDTIGESPHVRELRSALAASGLGLAVRSVHGPLGIPAFRARIQPLDRDDRTPGTSGFGAHFVADVALARAITEAAQGRITKIAGSRDDFYPHTYRYIDEAILSDRPGAPPPESPGLAWNEIPRPPPFSSFAQALAWTLERLASLGFRDTCYFDQRRPELGNIPIVSVVSPMLRFDRSTFYRGEQE
jgi:ribosomal protein S12 methylthiotransferase accessory factor